LFKENRVHEIPELFSEKNILLENLRKRYEKSWAKGFYEDVFCRIDETVFSVLYSDKVSRPNLPVNIYVSLEILKELFGFSDETKTKIQEIAQYLFRIKVLFANDSVSKSKAYKILTQLVDEQIDSGFGTFIRYLEYKADWYGKTLIVVDRFYPSSKLCNVCI